MSKRLRLTRPARAQLKSIVRYTLERFGPAQAERYRSQLVSSAERLCGAEFSLGRSCVRLTGGDLKVPNLLYYREGMHYIIYVDTVEVVTIHDFVYVGRDLPTIISSLEAGLLDSC